MSRFFDNQPANRLTKWSQYYVDWSRVGELISSGSHRYNLNEIFQRGFIISSTAAAGLIAYTTHDEQSSLSRNTSTIAWSMAGFALSHTFVIFPLIYKRYQMSQDCLELETELLECLAPLDDSHCPLVQSFVNRIKKHCTAVMNHSLSDEKASKASQTLGRRKSLVHTLLEWVKLDIQAINEGTENIETILKQWPEETEECIERLNNKKREPESSHLLASM